MACKYTVSGDEYHGMLGVNLGIRQTMSLLNLKGYDLEDDGKLEQQIRNLKEGQLLAVDAELPGPDYAAVTVGRMPDNNRHGYTFKTRDFYNNENNEDKDTMPAAGEPEQTRKKARTMPRKYTVGGDDYHGMLGVNLTMEETMSLLHSKGYGLEDEGRLEKTIKTMAEGELSAVSVSTPILDYAAVTVGRLPDNDKPGYTFKTQDPHNDDRKQPNQE